jgi:quercetin dioxygenase-like cupin family protein
MTRVAPVRSQNAAHVAAGTGPAIWTAGDTYTLKADSASTDGALAFLEASVPPGSGPPPHRHSREDEAYYVLAGRLEVLTGEHTFIAGPGDFVFIPRGTMHRFKNVGVDAARMVIMFVPGGFDGFLRGVGEPARPGETAPPIGPEELRRVLELAPRYGLEMA